MRTYGASQKLVDILLKNGFADNTEKDYPQHFKKMNEKGYDPDKIKRQFARNSHKDYIIFDYINIHPMYNGSCHGNESRITLTEPELKSMITFYKLTPQDRNAWRKLYDCIPELHLHYEKVCEQPRIYKTPLDKRVKEIFENIVLD